MAATLPASGPNPSRCGTPNPPSAYWPFRTHAPSGRAQGNKEGLTSAAPSARLTHGLTWTKEQRRLRATTPHFQPGTGLPARGDQD